MTRSDEVKEGHVETTASDSMVLNKKSATVGVNIIDPTDIYYL